MANWTGTTRSNDCLITPGNAERINQITNEYPFGEIDIKVEQWGDQEVIRVYGYDDMACWNDEGEDLVESWMEEIRPFLKEVLIIKTVGAEKCRYTSAGAYIVPPITPDIPKDEQPQIRYVSLDDAIVYQLQEDDLEAPKDCR